MGCRLLNKMKMGECCCKCNRQYTVYKHPWNQGFAKGPISKIMGYACSMPEFNKGRGQKTMIFFNNKHGMCEMFEKNVL